MASSVNVNGLSFDGESLTITAEAGDGEVMTLCLTPERVAGVERIACVNNGFYCVQIELQQNAYLQIGMFL